VARESLKNASEATPRKKRSPLAGGKGVAAGVGLAAVAPMVAKKGVDAVRGGDGLPSLPKAFPKPTKLAGSAASIAGDKVGSRLKDAVDEAGGASGLVKDAAGGLLPGGGGDSDGKDGMPGVGKGRRMPVQQAIDVAVPLETAYNQWTQFEDWPEFMHRVTRVTQEDDCTVSFATKIWGKTKEFKAQIETQRPDERIKWRVAEGLTHAGVVTFHELAPKLTRIEVNLDIEPGSLIEKAARGMRHVKRAARADLARFKAFIEMQELETGAWRGVIEDGEVVDPHDDSYDEERDYSEVEDVWSDESGDDEDASGGEEDEDQDDDSQKARTQRFKRQAQTTRSGGGSSSRSSSGSSSSSSRGGSSKTKSSGGRSRSAATSKSKSSRSSGGSSSNGRSGSSAKRSTSSSSKSASPKRKSTRAKS